MKDYLWRIWLASQPGREVTAEEELVRLIDRPPFYFLELHRALAEASTAG